MTPAPCNCYVGAMVRTPEVPPVHALYCPAGEAHDDRNWLAGYTTGARVIAELSASGLDADRVSLMVLASHRIVGRAQEAEAQGLQAALAAAYGF